MKSWSVSFGDFHIPLIYAQKNKAFVKPCFGESFSEFGAVICLHTFHRHRESLNEMHRNYHGRVGAVLFKGFHITPA